MLAYAMIGTNDLPAALRFWGPILGRLGLAPNPAPEWRGDRYVWFSPGGRDEFPMVVVTRPRDGRPAGAGNGAMIALAAAGPEEVAALHAMALAAGGTDEGPPGPRSPRFFGAYVRDPEGNKACFFHYRPGAGDPA